MLEARRMLAEAGLLMTFDIHDVSARTDSLLKGVNVPYAFWSPQERWGLPIHGAEGWTSQQWSNYVDNPSDPGNSYFPSDEQRKLKNAGFDHVRLAVDITYLMREIIAPASVWGIVFRDNNANGWRDGEPGLGGVTVFDDANGNAAFDGGEASTATDVGGFYSISGLLPGSHSFRVGVPNGFTTANPVQAVSLAPNSNQQVPDFALVPSVANASALSVGELAVENLNLVLNTDYADVLRDKVKQITDNGLSVILCPFRSNDQHYFIDGMIWEQSWQNFVNDFWNSFSSYVVQQNSLNPSYFDPEKVHFQLLNEPRLDEVWRGGSIQNAGTAQEAWVVQSQGSNILKIYRDDASQPDADHILDDANAWYPIQNRFAQTFRANDTSGRYTLVSATPIHDGVTFDVNDFRLRWAQLTTGAADVSAKAAVTSIGFDATLALSFAGSDALIRRVGNSTDGNVVYGLHFYTNGIFTTNQGHWNVYGANSGYDYLIFPLPRQLQPANTTARADQIARIKSAVRTRMSLTASGTPQLLSSGGLSDEQKAVRSQLGETNLISLWSTSVEPRINQLINLSGSFLDSGQEVEIRQDIDDVQQWASNNSVFAMMDEFGVRRFSWHWYGDIEGDGTYDIRYVDPFSFDAESKKDRTDWLRFVRQQADASSDSNGDSAYRMGYTAWDYTGDLAITLPELTSGASIPTLALPPSGGWQTNIVSYRRRLESDVAGALNVSAFGYDRAISMNTVFLRDSHPHYIDVVFSSNVKDSVQRSDFEIKAYELANGMQERVMSESEYELFSYDHATNTQRIKVVTTGEGNVGNSLRSGRFKLTVKVNAIHDSFGSTLIPPPAYEFSFLVADFNHDNQVNFDDLLVLSQYYGMTQHDVLTSFGIGDANGDGYVNFDDLLILSQYYGWGLV